MKNTKKTQVKKSAVKKAGKASTKAKPAKTVKKAAVKPARKPATKPAKKASVKPAKKVSTKKAPAKAASKKPIVKKQAPKKAAKPAAKKAVVKKAAPKKTAAKKAVAKKPVAKKTAAKKPVVKKAVSKKTLKTKAPVKKTAAKKPVKTGKSAVSAVSAAASDARFSDAELAKFRQTMLAMRARALNKAESLQSQSLVRNDEVNQEEDGTDAIMRTTELTKANMNERQVRQIDDALKAIADGSYGICKKCGEKIGKARLEARPFAEYCISCQEEMENEQAIRTGFIPLSYYENNR